MLIASAALAALAFRFGPLNDWLVQLHMAPNLASMAHSESGNSPRKGSET